MKISLFFLILFFSLSCAKKIDTTKYTLEEFNALAHEASAYVEKGGVGLNLADYAPGVSAIDSQSLIYKRLVFFAVKFETAELARSEAKRLNQYYVRNWLFDRVEGEPVLEDYVITTFKAENPNRKIQRVPQKNVEGEHSAHGEAHH